MRLRPIDIHLSIVIGIFIGVMTVACSQTGPTSPAENLCRGDAGVGARITGASKAIDFCVPNDQVITAYSPVPDDRYMIHASFTSDSVTIEIDVSFNTHKNLPQVLNLSADQTLAYADPDGAWLQYREFKPGVYDYSSREVSGVFTLTFSDPEVAAGTFNDVQVGLIDDSTGDPAGSRGIEQGFFAVSPSASSH